MYQNTWKYAYICLFYIYIYVFMYIKKMSKIVIYLQIYVNSDDTK
jgi:hypothetical protein